MDELNKIVESNLKTELERNLKLRELQRLAIREYDMIRFEHQRELRQHMIEGGPGSDLPEGSNIDLGEYKHGDFLPELTYLITYPRSGANWLRYCLEAIYLLPTYGVAPQQPLTWLDLTIEDACRKLVGVSLGVDRTDGALFQHSHRFKAAHDSTRIFTILRNPKEAILREFRGQYGDEQTRVLAKKDSLRILEFEDGLRDYKALIDGYHQHKGEKHIIYYEDLLSDPLNTLLSFHDSNTDFFPHVMNPKRLFKRILSFVEHIDEHAKVSISIYNNGVAKSYTSGKSTSLSKHSNEFLSKEEKLKWDERLKEVFDKETIPYIKRYFE